jgi:DNA-binding CsgD family transcriptional regulator
VKHLSHHIELLQSLSPREREVLAHLCAGAPTVQIADELSITESTVNFHLRNIYRKLELDGLGRGARHRALGQYCLALPQLIEPPPHNEHLEDSAADTVLLDDPVDAGDAASIQHNDEQPDEARKDLVSDQSAVVRE